MTYPRLRDEDVDSLGTFIQPVLIKLFTPAWGCICTESAQGCIFLVCTKVAYELVVVLIKEWNK